MKKISCILLMFIFCLFLSGCKTIEKIDDSKEFLDLYYEYYAGYESDFVGIDLRDYDNLYTKGHFKGFVSFNYESIFNDFELRFSQWIKVNYGKKVAIFLVDDGSGAVVEAIKVLEKEGYKSVYGFTKGYLELVKANNGLIEILTGGEGCDC